MTDGHHTTADSGPVLVTGSAGFIGAHLVDHLGRSGRRVIGVDRRKPTIRAGQPDRFGNVRHVRDDLRTMDIAPLLDGVSSVVHLAALPGVRPSWERFDEYVDTNIIATRRLLEACLSAGVARLVIASSSSVYGNRSGGRMAEHQPPAPVSPYAVTKLAAERLAVAYAVRPDSTLSTVALRFFTVYGPGQRPDMLISRLIGAALNGTEIRIFGDGSQRRDFVYVEDVVRAVDAALRSPGRDDVVNVGTGQDVSVTEIIEYVSELVGRRPLVRLDRQHPGDVTLTRADVRRAAELLGFRCRVPLREGLLRHIESIRQERVLSGV